MNEHWRYANNHLREMPCICSSANPYQFFSDCLILAIKHREYNKFMRGFNQNGRRRNLSSMSSNSYHPNRSASYERTPIKSQKLRTRNRQLAGLPLIQKHTERHLIKKMRKIDRLSGSFKRANNNCQRKYISTIKNQLKPYLNLQTQIELDQRYASLSNSRVYFFVLLTYIKWLLKADQIRSIYAGFLRQIGKKIANYTLEMQNSRNENFCNFRRDQIVELKSAKESIRYFLKDYNQEAIKILFLKDKETIIKKEDYFKSLLFIKDLQRDFSQRLCVKAFAMKINELQLEDKTEEKDNFQGPKVEDRAKSICSNNQLECNQVQIKHTATVKIQNMQQQGNLLPKVSGGQQPDLVKYQQQIVMKNPLLLLENSIGTSDYYLLNRIVMEKQKKLQFHMDCRNMQRSSESCLKVLAKTVEATGFNSMVKQNDRTFLSY